MKVQTEKKLVPKLRFGEFKEDWDLQLLGNTCTVKTGKKDTQDRDDGGLYPFFVRSNTVERINSFSFDGEAILTSGDGVGVGKNFHYINGKFDYHQRVYALRNFKNEYYAQFIFQVFVEKFYRRVIRLSAKNSVDSVRMNMITEMELGLPTLPEQQKIASFLSAVDKKIEQLTQKKSLLETYKKGVMQKIFSQELRFKKDDGSEYPDWEEKKLGEVSNIKMGQSPDSKSYNQNGEGIFLIQGNADISNRKSNPRQWTSSPTKICEKGDLILTVRAPVGAISKSVHYACVGRGVCAIKNNKYSILEFLYQFLLDYELKWVRLEQGSTFTAVSGSDIKSIKMDMPSVEEQQKIASFLSAIDNKIELVNTQLEQTKVFKKGLLQQMFV